MISDNGVKFNGFTANTLKYYAIFAMILDHLAWAFVPTNSPLGQIMHIFGRTTAPIMCFFIAEGFYYTRNVKKYILRMWIFSLISWFPFLFMEGIVYFHDGNIKVNLLFSFMQSVIYTFLIGLLILVVIHSRKINKVFKVVLVILLLLLSFIGDWMCIAPVWIIVFDRFRGDFKKQAIAFFISSIILITFLIYKDFSNSLFQYSVLLALIPLSLYNGKRGGESDKKIVVSFNKWFFYIFYPLHMIIIGILKLF